MKKKFLHADKVLVGVLLTLTFSALTVDFVACENYGAELEFTLSEDETYYSVTGIGTCSGPNLTIPSSYKNLPVREIGARALSGSKTVSSVVIPLSVTSIGEHAFSSCTALTKIEVPESVTAIGNNAFAGCTALTNAVVGVNVETIGDYAFNQCAALESVEIGEAVVRIGSFAFQNCPVLTDVYINDIAGWCNVTFDTETANPLYHAKNLYVDGMQVEKLVLPNGVESISAYAFCGWDSLLSIEMPDSLTSIEEGAFKHCASLASVELPDSVKSIGKHAFLRCVDLTRLEIGEGLESLGESAFFECYKLVEIFNKSKLRITTDGDSYVGRYAKNVYTPTSGATRLVTDDDGYILYKEGQEVLLVGYMGKETELVLPEGITGIYEHAFKGDEDLISIELSDTVKEIANEAFYNCKALESVIIGSGTTRIGMYAFSSCVSLAHVTFENANGWYYLWSSESAAGESILEENLLDTATAANYLTSVYYNRHWYRSNS